LGKDELGDEFLKVLRSKKVDVETEGCVQRVEGRPTRDVYVVYTKSGDREFVGFGEKTPTEGYADCFIDPSKLPTGLISSAGALVTGTLGLAYPQTAEAMRRAVGVARGARVPVIVDVNWRPVFFEKPESEATKDEIREYVLASADVVKLSDGRPSGFSASRPRRRSRTRRRCCGGCWEEEEKRGAEALLLLLLRRRRWEFSSPEAGSAPLILS